MANNSDGGAAGLLGVLIGALIVLGLAYLLFGERLGLRSAPGNVKVEVPLPKK